MSDTTENPSPTPPAQRVSEELRPAVAADAPAETPARRHRISVVLKLTLLVGLTLALLLAVLVTANGLFWQGVLRKTVDSHLSGVAVSRRDMVRAEFALLRQRVELSAHRGEIRGFFYGLTNGSLTEENRAGSLETLNRLIQDKPLISASLVNTDGQIVLSTFPQAIGRDDSAEPEFRGGLQDTYIGLPRFVDGRYRVTVATPVRSQTEPKRTYGILMTTADVTGIADGLRDTTGLGETGDTLLVVRQDGLVRFLFPPRNQPNVALGVHSMPPRRCGWPRKVTKCWSKTWTTAASR